MQLAKSKIRYHGHVTNDLNGAEIIETSYENELHKTNQQEFRIKKITERKRNELYVKLKGHDNSFNNWIDKNDIQ